jgi:hypothetical protein
VTTIPAVIPIVKRNSIEKIVAFFMTSPPFLQKINHHSHSWTQNGIQKMKLSCPPTVAPIGKDHSILPDIVKGRPYHPGFQQLLQPAQVRLGRRSWMSSGSHSMILAGRQGSIPLQHPTTSSRIKGQLSGPPAQVEFLYTRYGKVGHEHSGPVSSEHSFSNRHSQAHCSIARALSLRPTAMPTVMPKVNNNMADKTVAFFMIHLLPEVVKLLL